MEWKIKRHVFKFQDFLDLYGNNILKSTFKPKLHGFKRDIWPDDIDDPERTDEGKV